MRGLILCLGLLAGAAQGQIVAEGVQTRSAAGPILIIESDDGWSRILQVGERRFFENGIFRWVSVRDQRGALYLVEVSTGGTGCAAQYGWLHTETGTARMTDLFGNCSELVEVSSDAETVQVLMPAHSAADGFVAYIYDGRSIEEVIMGQRSLGVGLEAASWIGRYPFEVMRDADWRGTLAQMMGEADYRRAGDVIATSSPFEVQGNWVVGEGFNTRVAGDALGVVALSLEDAGRAIIAICSQERGVEVWGELEGSVPQAVQDLMNGP